MSFHGDEGQAKRQRSTLVLSWSSLAVHGKSELTKFPLWFLGCSMRAPSVHRGF